MLKFFVPLSFIFVASTAQAMFPNPRNDLNAVQLNDDFRSFVLAMMAEQQLAQQAYDPYAGLPTFEKEITKIVYSLKDSEEKKKEIIDLIFRNDLEFSYEEKVNSILKYFPSSMSDSSFSEMQCIELSKVLAEQNPVAFFNMCVYPVSSFDGPSSVDIMNQDVRYAIIDNVSSDHFETLFNSQSNIEKRLQILGDMIKLKKSKNLIRVFNKYLDLKKEFNAPFLPESFRVVNTNQDFIAEFYALTLAHRVPEILMDKTLNLDLKERIKFANRCQSDFITAARGRGIFSDTKTPQTLIDFYKFVATCEDATLTINERFNAFEQLFVLSEGKEKQVIIDALQNNEGPFALRHKLSHFAKHSMDEELQEKGTSFIVQHQEEIQKEAEDRYNQLSDHSRMGIPRLREADASGKGTIVAVCDCGFYKILPQNIYESDLMKKFANDEKSYQWKMLHKEQILHPHVFDENWLTEIKNPDLPYHGSEMSDHVVTIAPEACIVPVAVHTNSSQSIIDAFNYLAEDSNVNIISCSFMLPNQSDCLNAEIKKSIFRCLKNNKILVLGVGNHGAYIPDEFSESELCSTNMFDGITFEDMFYQHEMQEGLTVINNLFKGEDTTSSIFSNLILVGSSKENSLELHEKSVKPGNGPAQKQFVYADADELKNFFDDEPCWGGTSAATAMVSGILADLWSKVQNPDNNTAARVSRALLENTDIDDNTPVKIRGRGKVNAEKALENLDKY